MSEASFGELLKQRRRQRDMTRERLAEEVAVAAVTVVKYETGERHPSAQVAERLANVLYPAGDDANRAIFLACARMRAQPTPQPPKRESSLLGRAAELKKLKALLLHPNGRLITIKGPPGSGKSSLARELVDRLSSDIQERRYYVVDLDAISERDQLFERIAHAVIAQGRQGEAHDQHSLSSGPSSLVSETPEQRVLRLLPHGQVLLLLDNLELVERAALGERLAALLQARPGLTLLLTSRHSLDIKEEQSFVLPPLPCPDPAQRPLLEKAKASPAVRLFVERAQAVRSSFTLTEENYLHIVAICVALDGLPLAIELAAAQSVHFSPRELHARLSNSASLLGSDSAGLPWLQQSLHSALGWSYDMLQPHEQALFRRLGVFPSGFSLDATIALANDLFPKPGASVSNAATERVPYTCLDALTVLVNYRLLRLGDDEQARYTMLEVVRSYASRELEAHGETAAVRQRLVAYYLKRSQELHQQSEVQEREQWFDQLDRELATLEAVLTWAIEDDIETAASICDALVEFWQQRGHWRSGRMWLDAILAHNQRLSAPLHRRTLRHAALMARRQGDYEQARGLLEAYLSLCREIGDTANIAYTLNLLGLIAAHQGHYPQADHHYAESLGLWTALGSLRNVAAVTSNQASLADIQGDYARAEKLHKKVYAIRTKLGDLKGVCHSLCNLGMVALHEGTFHIAQKFFKESERQVLKLHDTYLLATIRCNLAFSVVAQDEITQGEALLRASFQGYDDLGDQRGMAYSLEGLALTAAMQRCIERTARLFGAAAALRERINAPLPQIDRTLYERCLLKTQLRFASLQDEPAYLMGRSLSLAQIRIEALEAKE